MESSDIKEPTTEEVTHIIDIPVCNPTCTTQVTRLTSVIKSNKSKSFDSIVGGKYSIEYYI